MFITRRIKLAMLELTTIQINSEFSEEDIFYNEIQEFLNEINKYFDKLR